MIDPKLKSFIEKTGGEYLADGGLEDELYREVASGHPLYGVQVQGVARRGDDVLYKIFKEHDDATEDETVHYAMVHLTWTAIAPDRPPWPECETYHSMDEWYESIKNSSNPSPLAAQAYTDGVQRVLGLTPFTWFGVIVIVVLVFAACLFY